MLWCKIKKKIYKWYSKIKTGLAGRFTIKIYYSNTICLKFSKQLKLI